MSQEERPVFVVTRCDCGSPCGNFILGVYNYHTAKGFEPDLSYLAFPISQAEELISKIREVCGPKAKLQ